MKHILLSVVAVTASFLLFSQNNNFGLFQGHQDIGHVKIPGGFSYHKDIQEYVISGSGQNIWFTHDDFHFAWKKLKGDFILDARLQFTGKGANPHRKAGWMVRHSLETNTPYADVAVHGEGLTSMQYRPTIDSITAEIKCDISAPDIIRLERKGNTYIFYAAKYGDPLREYAKLSLNLGDEVYAGLFICSHEENIAEEAVFSNVRITIPAKDSFVPYKDYPCSVLETADVETGLRKILYSSAEIFEAPNWLKDGSALIYNSKGLLYRFPFSTNTPEIINTDFIKHCNNDHILSPDNKWIGVSSNETQTGSGSTSLIYMLPIEGGIPKQVTATGPSYLHGWSADGRTLAYCAKRNDNFDVYTISTKGGKEKKLTSAAGLDDGPEYSPDGHYIYYNSSRSGTMQIWRMKPDGSSQEQVTDDAYQNWFAHISPDGQWMAFISFTKDVDANDHPPCKRVMIRLMPVNKSSKPTVLAYIYGGQGTINVPSWSPDSKKIAFVSYTFPDNYYEKK